jgi:hypothetical protein
VTLTEDDLKLLEQQIRTVIRAEIVSAFGKLAASAGWYTSGFGELTESAAHLLKDAVEMATRELIPAEPEPVNPFSPKRAADQWAVILRAAIDAAEADGWTVWIDTEDYFGPGPFVRIGPPDSTGADDPIIWGSK